MPRYPQNTRNPSLHCSTCTAPVVKKGDDRFVCVDCGSTQTVEPNSRQRDKPVSGVTP